MPDKFEMDKKEMNLKTPPEDVPERIVFFCEAKGGTFSGLIKEERYNDGSIKTPEDPIRFRDYIYTTDKPEEIAFLREKTKKDTPPRIIECKTLKEWEELAHAARLKRTGLYTTRDQLETESVFSGTGNSAADVGIKEEKSTVTVKNTVRK